MAFGAELVSVFLFLFFVVLGRQLGEGAEIFLGQGSAVIPDVAVGLRACLVLSEALGRSEDGGANVKEIAIFFVIGIGFPKGLFVLHPSGIEPDDIDITVGAVAVGP